MRTIMVLEAGFCVTSVRVRTEPTIERLVVGACAFGGWFEQVMVDVGGGESTERVALVDGEPYRREIKIYTLGSGKVYVEVRVEPDAGGIVDPREARRMAERKRGLDPVLVFAYDADGPWRSADGGADGAAGTETPVTPEILEGAYLAFAEPLTLARILVAPQLNATVGAVGPVGPVGPMSAGEYTLSVSASAGLEVAGSRMRVDVRAATRTVVVAVPVPKVTAPATVSWVPGLTTLRFTITGYPATPTGLLVVVVDGGEPVLFPLAPAIEAMLRLQGHSTLTATIKGTTASCVVRIVAPSARARLVSAWMLASSARFAVTPSGISARVRRVSIELLDATGARDPVVRADAVWLDERGEPVSPAARVDVEDGLLVLERDQAAALGMIVVRRGAVTASGGVTVEELRAINGTSMAAAALCEPWHVGRDALVGLVAGTAIGAELRFRHRYCAAVTVAPKTIVVSAAAVALLGVEGVRVTVVAQEVSQASELVGLSVAATFDDGSASIGVTFVVYPASTAPFGAPFSALGAVVDRPFPWPVEYVASSTAPQGFALEHADDGRLRVTPTACALGHVESAAWLHDTLRGRSLCFEAARVPVVQAVASATIEGRVVSVLGAAGTAPPSIVSIGSVLVDGIGAGFVVSENRIVLDEAPGTKPVELRLVVCARFAAGVLTVAESGARALLCTNGAWRPKGAYELTAVDAHGQACAMPQGGAGVALEASVDGTTWVPVAAAFTGTDAKLIVVPETWGAFSDRRIVFAGRSIRVVVSGFSGTGTGTTDTHADFTFSTGSLVSASPTISHGANNVATTGSITAARCSAGAFFATSDARLKTNVETIDGALEKCQRMRGVTFEYAADRGVVHVGLIAQEVGAVFPSLVTEIDGYQRVDYSKLVGVLIEAVKELALR